ncbi:MAG: DUF4956 domain-containing protein [Lachnospiraceae bacterium]|nr:DUF4956 domain-containing protein [Lachnospiraceae bacterium]
MLDTIFSGVFDNGLNSAVDVPKFILCIAVSFIIGVIIALTFRYKNRYTKSFVVTVSILPAVVCVVIMMVNGNIGTGIAVAGAFSLVRFRSIPGTAKEISTIFIAMSAGLITGVGYLGYAVLFTVIICAAILLFSVTGFGRMKESKEKSLKITIPEDLNYIHAFDDIMEKYTSKCETVSVKTTNMGSMFKIQYNIILKNSSEEKEFIDALRTRNGNLEIIISMQEVNVNEL